jgi:hypothetical protein
MRIGSNDVKVWVLRALAIAKKLALATILLTAALAAPTHAQFIGYVGLQTVASTPFNNVACTGSFQQAVIPNLGQTSHYIVISGGSILSARLLGSNDGGVNFVTISDTLVGNGSSNQPTVVGSGYYGIVEVGLTCSAGNNVTVKYTGQGITPGAVVGDQQISQYEKVLGGASLVSTSQIFQTPFSSSAGNIYFQYSSAGAPPTGSTVQVICSQSFSNALPTFNAGLFTVVNNTTLQSFTVPPNGCPYVNLAYNAGTGGSGNTFVIYDDFAVPGVPTAPTPPAYTYTHITGTTATTVKATGGFVHTLNVNTGGAGTVSIFDLATASCTGTPVSNPVAVITATATTLQTFTLDVSLTQGICVKASVAMDLTVSSQ